MGVFEKHKEKLLLNIKKVVERDEKAQALNICLTEKYQEGRVEYCHTSDSFHYSRPNGSKLENLTHDEATTLVHADITAFWNDWLKRINSPYIFSFNSEDTAERFIFTDHHQGQITFSNLQEADKFFEHLKWNAELLNACSEHN